MKVVKNSCFGGFGLSPRGMRRYAELKGKECHFFTMERGRLPITLEEAEERGLFWLCYTVPNPEDYRLNEADEDGLYKGANARASEISLDPEENRADPDLVKVVEELGEEANGRCAQLEVVEIPDDVEFFIDEYDGSETIREEHRTW